MDMRITSALNAYSVQPGRSATQVTRAEKERADTDKVSLSSAAGDYTFARSAVAAAPDVRESVVTRIQEMLAAGTYRVSPQEVAASIFRGI